MDVFLKKLVDTLLPGLPAEGILGALPAASAVGIDEALAVHLNSHPQAAELQSVIDQVAAQAGGAAALATADETTAAQIVAAVEAKNERQFDILLELVAADYYEHPDVMRAFGWRPGPPQPEGYRLE